MQPFHATRLAPSPTGALHLGHARTFLLTWLIARQSHAKIYMRMEDIDAQRAKPESIQQAYDDLHWLGLNWDPYPSPPSSPLETRNPKPETPVTQSHRLPLYQATLDSLWQQHKIYPCTCTRADIAASVQSSASAPHDTDPNPRYPGTCRDRFPTFADTGLSTLDTAAQILASTGKPPCFRLRIPENAPPTTFTDLLAGPQTTNVLQDAGDFPLTRFYQPNPSPHLVTLSPCHLVTFLPPAYQLACVTDDHAMAIDLVIRGDDLLPSTPRQILVYQALGWQPPHFAHVPLVVGTDGKRLAKRHGESRIAQFRSANVSPKKIVGWAAWRSGQLPNPQEITPQDLLKIFNPTLIPKERITLTQQDLDWLS